MSNLLNVVDELDDLLFDGRQKNERRAATALHNTLFSFGLSIDRNYVAQRLPNVIRNLKVSLKNEHTKKAFPTFEGQESTELDVLFIDAPSSLGHAAWLNYYIEIELQQRDIMAFQRLSDFSGFCEGQGIDLFPILVTDMRKSEYVKDVCVINMGELRRIGAFYERYMDNIEEIPGLAYDDAASCFYILDLMSRHERLIKEQLLVELRKLDILKQNTLDFGKLVTGAVSLGDCLQPEGTGSFNQRMVEYIKRLKEKELLRDTADGKAHQLTTLSSKLILKWRAGTWR